MFNNKYSNRPSGTGARRSYGGFKKNSDSNVRRNEFSTGGERRNDRNDNYKKNENANKSRFNKRSFSNSFNKNNESSFKNDSNDNKSGFRSNSRFGGPKKFSSSRGGFSRGGNRGGGVRGGSRGRGRGGSNIHPSKFIKKAEVVEETVYIPEHTFKDFAVSEKLLNNLLHLGFVHPTEIQDKSIKFGLEGQDVLGIANTGTGKTAAFLIPMISKMITEKKKAIVLAPTRELAQQIEKEFRNFTGGMRLWTHLVVGGQDINRQIRQARQRNDIVIGTPGRVIDLISRKVLKLADVEMIVLDEADRMLDMGFRNDIESIFGEVSPNKQTFCYSATMSPEIEAITKKYLNNPAKVSVRKTETSQNVDQDVVHYNGPDEKIEKIHDLLIKPEFAKSIIFCRTKGGTEKLDRQLVQRGFKSGYIHGDLRQSARNRAIKNFKDSFINILIATDVASRGLDIKDVTHVINYDAPENYDDYVHRIGRTGRGGKKGFALTFVEGWK